MWHGMNKQIAAWCKACLQCQTQKVHRHVHPPVQIPENPKARFTHVHLDLVGPFDPSEGMKYLLTIIDRTTRWPEVCPLPDASAQTCLNAFINTWVARYGIPLHVTSDRGRQFTSNLWKDMFQRLGIQAHFTTAYHPASNSVIERFHRTLKTALRCRLTGPNWMAELPWVLLGLRNTPKEDIESSAAELLYGTHLTVPGTLWASREDPSRETALRATRANVEQFQPPPTLHHGEHRVFIPKSLSTADFVFVRVDKVKTPLQAPYTGPYKVLSKNFSSGTFTIQIGNKEDVVSIARLKPAFIDANS